MNYKWDKERRTKANWSGKISYDGCHKRVYRKRGKASKCVHCHTKTAKQYDWANVSGNYEDVNDYIELCSSCHKVMDGNVKNLENMKDKVCEMCGKTFSPTGGPQRFCGSRRKKTGCAYKNYWNYQAKYYRLKRFTQFQELKEKS